MRNNVERCPYCGWFMRYEDSAEWGEAWVCARQAEHIIADPENWSVDVIALGDDAVDTDGDPISGLVGAHRLTPDQLRVALGITESTDPYADCVCGHGRSTHVHYTGACGLCGCAAVRESTGWRDDSNEPEFHHHMDLSADGTLSPCVFCGKGSGRCTGPSKSSRDNRAGGAE